jgi:hypothetical protein
MNLPPLDGRGFLPDGCYKATYQEISKRFCINQSRQYLFQQFLDFLDHVNHLDNNKKYLGITVNTSIILSGSFFTDKPYPSDIDCVFILGDVENDVRWFWSNRLRIYNQEIKAQYNVDFNVELQRLGDFAKFFAYVGPKDAATKNLNPKDLRGIISLIR